MPACHHTDVGKGVSVLIVEDETVSRVALTSLLSACGYPTTAVASGEEALAAVEREGKTPTVALVDLDLPGMDGVEFIHRLWEQNPSIPAVLMTAASRELVSDAAREGIAHLRKPLDFKHLLAVLNEKSVRH